jgi:hypothetical protein
MNIKKTRINGIKIFQAPKGLMDVNDDSDIVKEALKNKPLKKWYQEIKQNKANTILFNNEDGEAYQATTITKDKKIYAGVAPNLIQAYFDMAYEQVQWTNKYANTFHYIAEKKFGEVHLIDTPIFHRFIQYRISAIIFLHLTIEAFINHIIPEDFIYSKTEQTNSGKYIENITKLSKNQIERWVGFQEKIEKVVPEIPNINFDIEKNRDIIGRILEIVKVRDEIIHLKSKEKESNIHYEKIFNFIGSKDLEKYLSAVKKFINIIDNDFIKIESIKESNYRQEIQISKPEYLHIGVLFEIINVKEKRITIYIKKWKGLTKESDKIKSVLGHLKLMEEMNLIIDYLIEEKGNKIIVEIFKNDEQVK